MTYDEFNSIIKDITFANFQIFFFLLNFKSVISIQNKRLHQGSKLLYSQAQRNLQARNIGNKSVITYRFSRIW